MQIKLVDTYISTLHAKQEYKDFIAQNRGKWLDVDTEYVFDNQYNVGGFRIYDVHIQAVKDDIRTDESIFFVKHPNGKDPIKDIDFNDHLKNRRFLSCYSVNGNYYRISRRSNIEFILVGTEIYTTNGIGYTPLDKARLTANEKKIVQYCADRILNK